MFFKPEHVEPILSGGKTQTRRQINTKHCAYKVGHIYQARLNYEDGAFAWLKITGVRQERLADMSEADCFLEGYDGKAEYREIYERIYGKFDENELLWVIDFELSTEGEWMLQTMGMPRHNSFRLADGSGILDSLECNGLKISDISYFSIAGIPYRDEKAAFRVLVKVEKYIFKSATGDKLFSMTVYLHHLRPGMCSTKKTRDLLAKLRKQAHGCQRSPVPFEWEMRAAVAEDRKRHGIRYTSDPVD